MSYEQFVCAMFESTKTKITASETLEKQEVLKNNGVTVIGLSIRKEGSPVTPVIYLEEFYKKYLLGITVDALSDFLVAKSRDTASIPVCNYEEIRNFDKIRTQIVYKLINAEKNEELLHQVPHLPMMDLAVVFYWMIPTEKTEYSSVLIRNTHMELWKLPISVLYHCAKENTQKHLPYVFLPLTEYVKELDTECFEKSPLYILSNSLGINGAAALLYPGMPEKIYETLGKNYYLLPSSIHEFLIVPEDNLIKPENLCRMVREVNATQIEPEELLSDHIYYFDGNIITKM